MRTHRSPDTGARGKYRLRGPLAIAATVAATVVTAVAATVLVTTPSPAVPRLAVSSSVPPRAIAPSETDPSITRPDVPHLVYPPASPTGNGMLLVNLGGSDSTPGDYTRFLGVATSIGFHTIGLSYPDARTVGSACDNDLDCYEGVRHNIFDGSPAPRGNVDRANAVDHRLIALLHTLIARYPGEGWAAYLRPDGLPDYGRIVFSGHSQGGGEAAFIAKIRPVGGVVMLSSIVDGSHSLGPGPKQPATWVGSGHLTPLERYTGFVHSDDMFVASIRGDWTSLGLDRLGPALSVDQPGDLRGTHELLMTRPGAEGFRAHLLPAVDSATPVCPDGSPALAPTWSYLMLTAAGMPAPNPAAAC